MSTDRDGSVKVSCDEVVGHTIKLSDGRLVFIGDSPNHKDRRFIFMQNANGDQTRFGLSHEALNAIVQLATAPPNEPLETFPHKETPRLIAWKVVIDTAITEHEERS